MSNVIHLLTDENGIVWCGYLDANNKFVKQQPATPEQIRLMQQQQAQQQPQTMVVQQQPQQVINTSMQELNGMVYVISSNQYGQVLGSRPANQMEMMQYQHDKINKQIAQSGIGQGLSMDQSLFNHQPNSGMPAASNQPTSTESEVRTNSLEDADEFTGWQMLTYAGSVIRYYEHKNGTMVGDYSSTKGAIRLGLRISDIIILTPEASTRFENSIPKFETLTLDMIDLSDVGVAKTLEVLSGFSAIVAKNTNTGAKLHSDFNNAESLIWARVNKLRGISEANALSKVYLKDISYHGDVVNKESNLNTVLVKPKTALVGKTKEESFELMEAEYAAHKSNYPYHKLEELSFQQLTMNLPAEVVENIVFEKQYGLDYMDSDQLLVAMRSRLNDYNQDAELEAGRRFDVFNRFIELVKIPLMPQPLVIVRAVIAKDSRNRANGMQAFVAIAQRFNLFIDNAIYRLNEKEPIFKPILTPTPEPDGLCVVDGVEVLSTVCSDFLDDYAKKEKTQQFISATNQANNFWEFERGRDRRIYAAAKLSIAGVIPKEIDMSAGVEVVEQPTTNTVSEVDVELAKLLEAEQKALADFEAKTNSIMENAEVIELEEATNLANQNGVDLLAQVSEMDAITKAEMEHLLNNMPNLPMEDNTNTVFDPAMLPPMEEEELFIDTSEILTYVNDSEGNRVYSVYGVVLNDIVPAEVREVPNSNGDMVLESHHNGQTLWCDVNSKRFQESVIAQRAKIGGWSINPIPSNHDFGEDTFTNWKWVSKVGQLTNETKIDPSTIEVYGDKRRKLELAIKKAERNIRINHSKFDLRDITSDGYRQYLDEVMHLEREILGDIKSNAFGVWFGDKVLPINMKPFATMESMVEIAEEIFGKAIFKEMSNLVTVITLNNREYFLIDSSDRYWTSYINAIRAVMDRSGHLIDSSSVSGHYFIIVQYPDCTWAIEDFYDLGDYMNASDYNVRKAPTVIMENSDGETVETEIKRDITERFRNASFELMQNTTVQTADEIRTHAATQIKGWRNLTVFARNVKGDHLVLTNDADVIFMDELRNKVHNLEFSTFHQLADFINLAIKEERVSDRVVAFLDSRLMKASNKLFVHIYNFKGYSFKESWLEEYELFINLISSRDTPTIIKDAFDRDQCFLITNTLRSLTPDDKAFGKWVVNAGQQTKYTLVGSHKEGAYREYLRINKDLLVNVETNLHVFVRKSKVYAVQFSSRDMNINPQYNLNQMAFPWTSLPTDLREVLAKDMHGSLGMEDIKIVTTDNYAFDVLTSYDQDIQAVLVLEH